MAAALAALLLALGYFHRDTAPLRAVRFEIPTVGQENTHRDLNFATAVSPASPIPPAPSGARISYGPSFMPTGRAMSARNYSPNNHALARCDDSG